MNKLKIPYGKVSLTSPIPSDVQLDYICHTSTPPAVQNEVGRMTSNALAELDVKLLGKRLNAHTKVAIAINDKTRPAPPDSLIVALLDWMLIFDVRAENITFFIAYGTHVPETIEAIKQHLPAAISTKPFRIHAHDSLNKEKLVYLGSTAINQTPVWINKGFYESDFKIVIGNIEPHHFMGFSGGVKTAAIGLAGAETIRKNHSLVSNPRSITANVLDNPMRVDVEEIGQLIGIDLALDSVLDSAGNTFEVLAGDPQTVFKAGYQRSFEISLFPVSRKYPLVIASCGGYPKDINFYQAQKGMTHAAMITEDDGTVILAAECQDGAGSLGFSDFMKGTASPQEVLNKWHKSEFTVGPHKAFLTARILKRINVILISALDPALVLSWHMQPANSLEQALGLAGLSQGQIKQIAVMPHAVATIPSVH